MDLRAQTRQIAGNYLRNEELSPTIQRNQQLQRTLLKDYAGDSPENLALLQKCLQEVEILGICFVIPKRRVMLSVHEMLRLIELGFRLGKLDPDFEVRVHQGHRTPYLRGEALAKTEWDQKFACVLKHQICLELLKEYRNAVEAVQQHSQRALQNKSTNSALNKALRQQTEEAMFQFKVPTKFDLQDPPLVPMEESVLGRDQEVMEATLTATAKDVLEQQQKGELPSLFNKDSLEQIRQVPHHILILLDMSASTFEKEIFKVANLACAELLRTLPMHLPNATLAVLPYSDSAQGVVTELQNFIAPGGTTAYDAVFLAAQKILGSAEGNRIVLHVSDGLPNSLEDARQQASQFPEMDIRYGQIIFGHTKRIGDLVDYLFVDEANVTGQQREATRFEKYVAHFTEVALASSGEQVILWVMQHLDEVMVSMLDLFVGQYFLQQAPTPTPSPDATAS